MVGINMEQGKTVYQNKGLIITEHNGVREYPDQLINKYDKIYRIKIVGTNQPTIEDAAALVFFLLRNKIKDTKFEEYKMIILDAINKAKYEREYPHNARTEYYM